MGKLVARLLKKTDLAVGTDGKVVLTEEEKKLIAANFGEPFLAKLEAMSFQDTESADNSQVLFDAAVDYRVQQVVAEREQTIATLRESLAALAEEPEAAPAAIPVSGSRTANAPLLDMNARHNALVAKALSNPGSSVFASLEDATIDVADLNKEFKTTMPPGVKLDLLTKRLYLGFNDSKYMTRITSNTDYVATAAIIDEVSQEFTAKWTPKGTMKFTPCRIPYRRHKINVEIRPADIIKSWLLFLYEQGKTLQEMPISKYIIEQHILPKTIDDITRSMIGKGKYEAAPANVKTGDAGRPASKSMDGYETILVEGKKSGALKINYFKGAVNPYKLKGQELLDYVNNFVDAISQFFVGNLEIFCAPQFLTHYQREDFAVNGKYTGQIVGDKVRFTNFTFAPLESMYNSQILFATAKSNFVELVDYSNAQNCITDIEKEDYDIKIFGEYSLSVGFKIGEAVYAAVPDDYEPSATVILDSPAVDTEDSPWTYGGAESLSAKEPLAANTEGA